MKHILLLLLCASALAFNSCKKSGEFAKPEHIHWEYEHPDWEHEGFGDCAGTVQTPINVVTALTVKAQLGDIVFDYTPFPMKILDNGHTIQVIGDGKSKITLNGASFTFKQFHFHHKSEHTINGATSDMEVHFVHVDDATGNITVLGMMLEAGAANDLVSKVWANIPATKEEVVTTNVILDLNDLLPQDKKYYTYTGSLTTPPCTQGLQWILFKEPVEISEGQINAFETLYENNARPIQPLNNRLVLEKI
jgi:carbonic anhydrase